MYVKAFFISFIVTIVFVVLCLVFDFNFEHYPDLWDMIYSCFEVLFIFCFVTSIIVYNFKYSKEQAKFRDTRKIEENLKKCMEDKLEGLWVKYGQAVCKNDYSEWHKEKDCFLNDFVSKNHTSYHHLNTINFDITAKFDEYWNELVENKSLEE